jgi:hypothetical protein
LTTSFDFAEPIIADTKIYAKAPAERTVLITVTLDSAPAAALLPGEYVWITGDFNSWSPNSVLMIEQLDGTWTTTLTLPFATTGITYKVLAVKSDAALTWEIVANENKDWYSNITSGSLDILVEKWAGRPPEPVEGNLFDDPSFEISGNYSVEQSGWTIEGLSESNPGNVWLTGTKTNTGSKSFADNASTNNYIVANQAILIYQEVAAFSNGLAATVEVTLSVWVNAWGTYTNFTLICGSQTHVVSGTGSLAEEGAGGQGNFAELKHTFTLTAGDIVSDSLKAGLSYIPTSSTDCYTFVDDFCLEIEQ